MHALCDFKPTENGFLSFNRGDIIRILDRTDLEDGWLFGIVQDKKGKFPANCVEDYDPVSIFFVFYSLIVTKFLQICYFQSILLALQCGHVSFPAAHMLSMEYATDKTEHLKEGGGTRSL